MANLKYTIETSADLKGFTQLLNAQERQLAAAEKAFSTQPNNRGFEAMVEARKAKLAELVSAYNAMPAERRAPGVSAKVAQVAQQKLGVEPLPVNTAAQLAGYEAATRSLRTLVAQQRAAGGDTAELDRKLLQLQVTTNSAAAANVREAQSLGELVTNLRAAGVATADLEARLARLRGVSLVEPVVTDTTIPKPSAAGPQVTDSGDRFVTTGADLEESNRKLRELADENARIEAELTGQVSKPEKAQGLSEADSAVKIEEAAQTAAVSAERAKLATTTDSLRDAELEEVVAAKQAAAAAKEHAKAATEQTTVLGANVQAKLADEAATKAEGIAQTVAARRAREAARASGELATAEAQEAAESIRADAATIKFAASKVTMKRATAEQVAEIRRLVEASNAEVAALAKAKTATDAQAIAARQAANAQAALNLRMQSGADQFGRTSQRATAFRAALAPLASSLPGIGHIITSLNHILTETADKNDLAAQSMKRWLGIGAVAFVGFEAVRRYKEHLDEVGDSIEKLSQLGGQRMDWVKDVKDHFISARQAADEFAEQLERVGRVTDPVRAAGERYEAAIEREFTSTNRLVAAQRGLADARVEALLKSRAITERQAIKLRLELDTEAFEQQLRAEEKKAEQVLKGKQRELAGETERVAPLESAEKQARETRDEAAAARLVAKKKLDSDRAELEKIEEESRKPEDLEKEVAAQKAVDKYSAAAAGGSGIAQLLLADNVAILEGFANRRKIAEALRKQVTAEEARLTELNDSFVRAEAEAEAMTEDLKEVRKALRELPRAIKKLEDDFTEQKASNAEITNANREKTFVQQQGNLVEQKRKADKALDDAVAAAMKDSGVKGPQVKKFISKVAKLPVPTDTEAPPEEFKQVSKAAADAGIRDIGFDKVKELAVAVRRSIDAAEDLRKLKPPALLKETDEEGRQVVPPPVKPLRAPPKPKQPVVAPPDVAETPPRPAPLPKPGQELNIVDKALATPATIKPAARRAPPEPEITTAFVLPKPKPEAKTPPLQPSFPPTPLAPFVRETLPPAPPAVAPLVAPAPTVPQLAPAVPAPVPLPVPVPVAVEPPTPVVAPAQPAPAKPPQAAPPTPAPVAPPTAPILVVVKPDAPPEAKPTEPPTVLVAPAAAPVPVVIKPPVPVAPVQPLAQPIQPAIAKPTEQPAQAEAPTPPAPQPAPPVPPELKLPEQPPSPAAPSPAQSPTPAPAIAPPLQSRPPEPPPVLVPVPVVIKPPVPVAPQPTPPAEPAPPTAPERKPAAQPPPPTVTPLSPPVQPPPPLQTPATATAPFAPAQPAPLAAPAAPQVPSRPSPPAASPPLLPLPPSPQPALNEVVKALLANGMAMQSFAVKATDELNKTQARLKQLETKLGNNL